MSTIDEVREAALDLLWSQWSELGVPGLRAPTSSPVVSPVDLFLFTPAILADRDPRLAGLVLSWCGAHGSRVFGARELSLRRDALPSLAQRHLDPWLTALNLREPTLWPSVDPSGAREAPQADPRPVPLRADRPAALQLRARALFGIGVRADVVCALLEAQAQKRTLASPDLAHLGHSARAAQLSLAALETAGVVSAVSEGRTRRYALTRPRALVDLLDAEGLSWIPWRHALPVALELVSFSEESSKDERARRVRAHAIAQALEPHLVALKVALPDLPLLEVRPGDADAADSLLSWGVAALRRLARSH